MHFRAPRSPKNAESGEGLRPFELRVNFKNPRPPVLYGLVGRARRKTVGFSIKLDLTFLEHFSH